MSIKWDKTLAFGHKVEPMRSISDLDPHVKLGQILGAPKRMDTGLLLEVGQFLDQILFGLQLLLSAHNSVSNVRGQVAHNLADILLGELGQASGRVRSLDDGGGQGVVELVGDEGEEGQEADKHAPGTKDGLQAGEGGVGLLWEVLGEIICG